MTKKLKVLVVRTAVCNLLTDYDYPDLSSTKRSDWTM